jgi:hypothetical protein
VNIDSTGTALNFYQATSASKGGAWLTNTSCTSPNFPCSTPTGLSVSLNASSLAAGTYTGEINIFEDTDPGQTMTIPVVLNVTP